jgi:glycosyltransferase involved in cell wall biosynthesis
MTMEKNDYQKGLELAEAGNYQQALEWIQRHLQTSPNDAEVLNDVGAILHCLGRSDEAINYFTRAKRLQGDSAEILWNLCEAYLAVGRAKEMINLFDDMEERGILNTDILNRAATVFLNQGDKANAVEMLLRSLKVWPDQEVIKPMLKVIYSKRPKIAFFCGGDGQTFLKDILEFTKRRFEVRVFEGKTEDELYELMRWSDISWFEWCTNLAVIGSNKPKVCKTIVRLHRYEAYENWPQQVNWDNVDVLITVGNNTAKEVLLKKVPALESRTSMVTIPNGVDLNKFKFVDRQRGKNIAFLANLRMVKNPGFALQCMQKLHYIDREYKLFFGGEFQDEVVEQYLKHMVDALDLRDVVFFDGRQENVNSWLLDKHYIVCTSLIESQGMGILEGMAVGLKPVIHNFPGANQICLPEFLFNISEEFCEKILSDSYMPRKYRKFVEERYSLKNQLDKVNSIFMQFELQIDSKQSASAKPQYADTAAVV